MPTGLPYGYGLRYYADSGMIPFHLIFSSFRLHLFCHEPTHISIFTKAETVHHMNMQDIPSNSQFLISRVSDPRFVSYCLRTRTSLHFIWRALQACGKFYELNKRRWEKYEKRFIRAWDRWRLHCGTCVSGLSIIVLAACRNDEDENKKRWARSKVIPSRRKIRKATACSDTQHTTDMCASASTRTTGSHISRADEMTGGTNRKHSNLPRLQTWKGWKIWHIGIDTKYFPSWSPLWCLSTLISLSHLHDTL